MEPASAREQSTVNVFLFHIILSFFLQPDVGLFSVTLYIQLAPSICCKTEKNFFGVVPNSSYWKYIAFFSRWKGVLLPKLLLES